MHMKPKTTHFLSFLGRKTQFSLFKVIIFRQNWFFKGVESLIMLNYAKNRPKIAKIDILKGKIMLMKPKTTHSLFSGQEIILPKKKVIISSQNLFFKGLKS